jgi:hypothetical protein
LTHYTREWSAKRIRFALARYLEWHRQILVPEFALGGGIMDLCQISAAGYVTEYEIKVTRADWRADREKAKWDSAALGWNGRPRYDRSMVSRFFYVVPAHLAEKIPDWVSPAAGVLSISDGGLGWDHVRELRPARRLKAEKISSADRERAITAFYFRCWRMWEADFRHAHNARVSANGAPNHATQAEETAVEL